MKLLYTAALALAAGVVAQTGNDNTTAPFYLKLSSENETIDGQYLGACHAGAAIEGLCLSGLEPSTSGYNTFHFNYSGFNDVGGAEVGVLSWTLTATGGNETLEVPSPLELNYVANSNVAVPLFSPQTSYTSVGFDAGGSLFVYSPYDDSSFSETERPTPEPQADYNWYVCYTFVGGYYYQAVTWVTAGEPTNPTCKKVCVEREFIET